MTAPTLTLCMIVRNECAYLPTALKSVSGLVDEICIVDTGSTDGTKEIARSAAHRFAEYPWENDFAAAKNACLGLASSDWVLFLDADEFLLAGDHAALRAALLNQASDAMRLPILNYSYDPTEFGYTPNNQKDPAVSSYPGYVVTGLCRLFRRTPHVYYEGAVHELVEPSLHRTNAKITQATFAIQHIGKIKEIDHALVKTRYEAYLGAHLKKVAATPDDPMANCELGINYLKLERWQEAGASLEIACRLSPNVLDFHLHFAIALLKQKDFAVLADRLPQWIATFGDHPLLLWLTAVLALEHGDFLSAEQTLNRVIAAEKTHFQGLMSLAEIFLHQKRFAELSATLATLEQHYPRCAEISVLAAQKALAQGAFPDVHRHLANIPPRLRVPLQIDKLAASALFYAKEFALATAALERHIIAYPRDGAAYFQLAVVRKMSGDQAGFRVAIQSAASCDPQYQIYIPKEM